MLVVGVGHDARKALKVKDLLKKKNPNFWTVGHEMNS